MTMNFVVFESGSRAGLSAELFFEHYVDATGAKHRLFLSDLDEDFQHIVSRHPQVSLIHDRQAFEMLSAGEAVIFPADELTRQSNPVATQVASEHRFSCIEPHYYKKQHMNELLAYSFQTEGQLMNIIREFGFTTGENKEEPDKVIFYHGGAEAFKANLADLTARNAVSKDDWKKMERREDAARQLKVVFFKYREQSLKLSGTKDESQKKAGRAKNRKDLTKPRPADGCFGQATRKDGTATVVVVSAAVAEQVRCQYHLSERP